ncbi:MAG: hypothetical protein JOZ78_21155 [Chroococcidiopsidaceae cyanobacterium CP_BM_ER_R8_30]|nr:hypothetical protein [Chroococcidiopsidaceae cyanobacterium CP_BM_ER_R8_30]
MDQSALIRLLGVYPCESIPTTADEGANAIRPFITSHGSTCVARRPRHNVLPYTLFFVKPAAKGLSW